MTPYAELTDRIAQFERANDLRSVLQTLAIAGLSAEDLSAIAMALFRSGFSVSPFLIVDKLLQSGYEAVELRALSVHLGLRLDQPAMVAASMSQLARLLEETSSTQRETVRDFFDPFLPYDIVSAFHSGNNALLNGYKSLYTLLDPRSLARFAPPPPDRAAGTARFRVCGDKTRLRDYDLTPASVPRQLRTAVIAARRYWFPESSATREHDIPVRITAAIEDYGWRAIRSDIRSFDDPATVTEDYRAMAAACRACGADVLIIDEFQPARGTSGAAGEIIRELKRDQPSLRIVGLYLDPWITEQWDEITAAADLVDAIWSPVVTEVWQRSAFCSKALFFPLPHGGGNDQAPTDRQAGFGFYGGVQYSNWDRAFWLNAIAEAGLPLHGHISSHRRDDLPPLESYRAYLKQIAASEAVLNFARRSNGIHTLTARTFEVPAVGGLLVQERSDNIDMFFVAGRHYLRFETLTDLADISHLIRTESDFITSMRREAATFFRERYADDKIIGYLDHFLFHRLATSRAA